MEKATAGRWIVIPLASPAQVALGQSKGDLDGRLGMNGEKSSFEGLRMISRRVRSANL
jgi:hypothetical protein